MAKCAATDPRGPTVSGRICFAPSRPKHSSIRTFPDTLITGTNLERDTGKTEDSLCSRIQLEGVNISLVPSGELTSAKTLPYLMTLSTTLSVGASINGECSFNSPSSSLSNKCRDSAFEYIISWMRWTTSKRRTVGLGEKYNSNEQRYFPTTTTSTLLLQIEQAARED